MFGYTIQIFGSHQYCVFEKDGIKKKRDTDANVIILSPCRETIRLARKGLILCGARLFEEDGLEVARRDGFTVMPAYFECPDAHWLT
jgi:hypothetical protein